MMRYIRCGPSCSRMCVPGRNAGVIPVKDTPTSCGSTPGLDDDSPTSGDDDSFDEDAPAPVDDAPAVVDDFSSSRRLFS